MKKKKQPSGVVQNRRAGFDYALSDELVSGMSLNGRQVRAARDGHVQLRGSYVIVRNGELWLNNASFTLRKNEKGGGNVIETVPIRLLATKKQILALVREKKAGMSIVPVRLLIAGNYIKLVIALGKGKRKYDKRQTIKKRDTERENRVKL